MSVSHKTCVCLCCHILFSSLLPYWRYLLDLDQITLGATRGAETICSSESHMFIHGECHIRNWNFLPFASICITLLFVYQRQMSIIIYCYINKERKIKTIYNSVIKVIQYKARKLFLVTKNWEITFFNKSIIISYNIRIYYTLRFYFPYLSLLAQPVTIFVYGPVTILVYGPASYLHYYFR